MSQSIEQLTQEVLALPIEERAALAARIVETIDEGGRTISSAWLDVAEKRRDEIRSGNARTMDAGEVSAHVRRHLQ